MYAEIDEPSPIRTQRPNTTETNYRRFVVAAPPSPKRGRKERPSDAHRPKSKDGSLSARTTGRMPSSRPSTTSGYMRRGRSSDHDMTSENGGCRVLPLIPADAKTDDLERKVPSAHQKAKIESVESGILLSSLEDETLKNKDFSGVHVRPPAAGRTDTSKPSQPQPPTLNAKPGQGNIAGQRQRPKHGAPVTSRPVLRSLGDGGSTVGGMVGAVYAPSNDAIHSSATVKVRQLVH